MPPRGTPERLQKRLGLNMETAERDVRMNVGAEGEIVGNLRVPEGARGLVILARRLLLAKDAASAWPETAALRDGYFGASTGAAAAIVAPVVVPGATHLFEEPGTLENVARLARDWFTRRLA